MRERESRERNSGREERQRGERDYTIRGREDKVKGTRKTPTRR